MDVRAKNCGRPHQKVRFSAAPVMGRNFLTQGRPGVRVRNVRGKSGPKSLCLCCFFPESNAKLFCKIMVVVVFGPSLRTKSPLGETSTKKSPVETARRSCRFLSLVVVERLLKFGKLCLLSNKTKGPGEKGVPRNHQQRFRLRNRPISSADLPMTPMEGTEHHFAPFQKKGIGATSGGPLFSRPLLLYC